MTIPPGRYGEREQWCLSVGWSGGGWETVPDLTDVPTRNALAELLDQVYPDKKPGMRSNATGQLWRLRHVIKPGDLVAMPLHHSAQIALGVVAGGYEYLHGQEPSKRHVLRVEWRRPDLPRTSVKQDLLHSLGGAMTIFGVTRHDGAARLWHLLEHGVDPGSRGSVALPQAAKAPVNEAPVVDSGEEEAEAAFDLERYARDQIARWITENFAGHKLQDLVAAVLAAHDYVVETPPRAPTAVWTSGPAAGLWVSTRLGSSGR